MTLNQPPLGQEVNRRECLCASILKPGIVWRGSGHILTLRIRVELAARNFGPRREWQIVLPIIEIQFFPVASRLVTMPAGLR